MGAEGLGKQQQHQTERLCTWIIHNGRWTLHPLTQTQVALLCLHCGLPTFTCPEPSCKDKALFTLYTTRLEILEEHVHATFLFYSVLFYSEWSDLVQMEGSLLYWSSHVLILDQRQLLLLPPLIRHFNCVWRLHFHIANHVLYHCILLEVRDYWVQVFARESWLT